MRGTRPEEGGAAVGVSAIESTLLADGLQVQDTAGLGLAVLDDSAVSLVNCTVRGGFSDDPDERPVAVRVVRAGVLTADNLVVADNQGSGIEAFDGEVFLTGGSITGTRAFGPSGLGRGLMLSGEAHLVAQGVLIEESHGIGLLASDPGTTFELLDSTVSLTHAAATSVPGGAIALQNGALGLLRGCDVRDNEGAGLYVAAASADIEDTTLHANGFAGAVCLGGRLSMVGSAVTHTVLDPAHGGGVGIFSQGLAGECDVQVRTSVFSDLPGSALYVRGPGNYLLASSVIQSSGAPPSMPGGVLALDAVQAPGADGVGMVIQGNRFEALNADAIVLDVSGAELALDPTFGPNTFGVMLGEPLVRQRCGPEVRVLDGSGADPTCQPTPRLLGPALEYLVNLVEVDPVE